MDEISGLVDGFICSWNTLLFTLHGTEYSNIREPVIRIDASYCRLDHVRLYNYALFKRHATCHDRHWWTASSFCQSATIIHQLFVPLWYSDNKERERVVWGASMEPRPDTTNQNFPSTCRSIIWNDLIPGTDSKCQCPEQSYSNILWGKCNFKTFWNIVLTARTSEVVNKFNSRHKAHCSR